METKDNKTTETIETPANDLQNNKVPATESTEVTSTPTEVAGEGENGHPKTGVDAMNADAMNEVASNFIVPKAEGNFVKNMFQNIGDNLSDIRSRAKGIGKDTQSDMEDVTPHYTPVTWTDVMNDPKYEGSRGRMVMNSLGGVLSALGSGQKQDTILGNINKPIDEQYGKTIAERNARAVSSNLDAIEASEKERMALESKLYNTPADAYIKRFNAETDTETKRMILEQMAKDSKVWANLRPQQKLDLLLYLKAVDGSGSILDIILSENSDKFGDLIDWMTGEKKNDPVVLGTVDGVGDITNDLSPKAVENLYSAIFDNPYTTIDEKEEKAKQVIDVLKKGEVGIIDLSNLSFMFEDAIDDLKNNAETASKANAKAKQALDDIRDYVDKGGNLDTAKKKLAKVKMDNVTDNSLIVRYDSMPDYFQGVGITRGYQKIVDGNLSSKEKLSLLEDYIKDPDNATYLAKNSKLKRTIDNAITNLETRATFVDPFTDNAMKEFENNTFKKRIGGNDRFQITEDGSVTYQGSGKQSFVIGENNVGSVTGDLTKVMDELSKYDTETIVSMFGKLSTSGTVSPEEAVEYFKMTPIYTAMGSLVGNKNLEKKVRYIKGGEDSFRKLSTLYNKYKNWKTSN